MTLDSEYNCNPRDDMEQLEKIEHLFLNWIKLLTPRRVVVPLIAAIVIFIILFRSCDVFSPKQQKVYHIGKDIQWYPLNLMKKEKNMTAFSDDLLLTIGKEEMLTFRLISVNSEHLLSKLDSEELDGIMSPVSPTPQNRESYLFSDTYFHLGTVLVVPFHSVIDTWEEMDSKTIGIQKGALLPLEAKKYPAIQFRPYDTVIQALSEVTSGQIDGALLPALPAYIYVKSFYSDTLKVATVPLTSEGLRLIALNNAEGKYLIDHFNHGLAKVKEDSTYSRLIEQWSLIQTDRPPKTKEPEASSDE